MDMAVGILVDYYCERFHSDYGIHLAARNLRASTAGQETRSLKRKTGNKELHTEWDDPERTNGKLWKRSLKRPWKLLFAQPTIQILALYQAYNYGILYLFISTYTTLWEDSYNETVGIAGLNFIVIAIGNLLASQICGPLNDKIYKYIKRKNGQGEDDKGTPEYRIPLMLIGAIISPI